MIEVKRYDSSMRAEWDRFVSASPNATFLHLRSYMEYHADRFADYSLAAFDSHGRLMTLLPACRKGNTVDSHAGLTYGGMIVGERHHSTAAILEAWRAMLHAMRADGVKSLSVKPVPWIYQRYPSDDDIYALFRSGASFTGCQISSALPIHEPFLFNTTTRQLIAKAPSYGWTVGESERFADFWQLLANTLATRHGAAPVHTLEEIMLLRSRFPKQIRLFTIESTDGELIAGTLLYFTGRVVHSQYIAVSPEGRKTGAFPALVAHILENECAGAEYFDFGTSCLDGGLILNESLNAQKYGLGGRPVAYNRFTVNL